MCERTRFCVPDQNLCAGAGLLWHRGASRGLPMPPVDDGTDDIYSSKAFHTTSGPKFLCPSVSTIKTTFPDRHRHVRRVCSKSTGLVVLADGNRSARQRGVGVYLRMRAAELGSSSLFIHSPLHHIVFVANR